MNIETHAFRPSRPDGIICVAMRRRPEGLGDTELCGYPLGHLIHGDVPSTGETHAQYDARREAELPVQLHAERATRANTPAEAPDRRAMDTLQQVHDFAAQSGSSMGEVLDALDRISEAHQGAASTPAEARTGISDRASAALAALTIIGAALAHDGRERHEAELQLIERALRGAASTPAEARTGISDRAAAALADVAYLRQAYLAVSPHETEALDRIERALRGER